MDVKSYWVGRPKALSGNSSAVQRLGLFSRGTDVQDIFCPVMACPYIDQIMLIASGLQLRFDCNSDSIAIGRFAYCKWIAFIVSGVAGLVFGQ